MARRRKKVDMLITRENLGNPSNFKDDRENIVNRMDFSARSDATKMIWDRYETARDTTDDIAVKMNHWDRLYKGEWEDNLSEAEKRERVFIPKSREHVSTISAYIMLLLSQVTPIVTVKPMVSTLWASNEEFERAKVAEALWDFYMSDVWHFRDSIFPEWLKHFLKYSQAIWKIDYLDDPFRPDLKISTIDRSLVYIDPIAKKLKDARWVIEKSYIPRSEAIQMSEDGHWTIPGDERDALTVDSTIQDQQNFTRFFGERFNNFDNIKEDELIEVWHYWQAPVKGLGDLYAVILGGEQGSLVRYGRNPYPYKGLPYVGRSYDEDEFRPDGTGLIEQYRPFQETINNFMHMRITDVRKNISRQTAVTGKFITKQTQEDFADGNSFIRLSEDAFDLANGDPSFDIRKHFADLPSGTSTSELLVQDLPFILKLGNESSQISEVFRGQNPQPGATLGQVQEQLARNQGAFRPIWLNIMRGIEELTEIGIKYFKSPDFFPTERIIQITGQNKYQNAIRNWFQVGDGMQIRSVQPDEMDVDVTINAVSGADALHSRTFIISSFEQMLQALGQIPELAQEFRENFDFGKIFDMMLNSSGLDSEQIRLTPQEMQQRAQQKQQAQEQAEEKAKQQQQEQMQLQLHMQQQMEQMKAEIDIVKSEKATQDKMAFDQAATEHKIAAKQAEMSEKADNELDLLRAKAQTQIVIDDNKLDGQLEALIQKVSEETAAKMLLMHEEAKLEAQNPGISVNREDNNVVKVGTEK